MSRKRTGNSALRTFTKGNTGRTTWKAYGKGLPGARDLHPLRAPWYIVPADDKENARLIVSQIVLDTLKDLKMAYPKTLATAKHRQELKSIRKLLAKEV